jgi:hypothetical protein
MSGATLGHYKAMLQVMNYCHSTPNRGLELKPNQKLDGNPNFEFIVEGRSDSDYAKDTDTCRSVSGSAVFLEGAPVVMRSSSQNAEERDPVGDWSQTSRGGPNGTGYALCNACFGVLGFESAETNVVEAWQFRGSLFDP